MPPLLPKAWILAIVAAATVLAAVAQQGPSPLDIPADAHKLHNAAPKGKDTLVQGAAIFQKNCSGCHGPDGVPVRKFRNLKQQPAVLQANTLKQFTDGDLFFVLAHGAPGGMPSFSDDLTEIQRWQCITFLRHLGKDSQKYSPPPTQDPQ